MGIRSRLFFRIFRFMEGLGGFVHDGHQFGQYLLLSHLLQGGQLRTNNISHFPDWFIQSVGILCLAAGVPAHHSIDDGTHHINETFSPILVMWEKLHD